MAHFIVLEGIDGSGKSSIADFIADMYEEVHTTREPSDSEPGELAKKISSEDTSPYFDLFLYLADRVEHTEKIKEKLNGEINVVCDRYWGSTAAYQSAYEEIELDYTVDIQEPFVLEPSLTILLDIDPKTSLERISNRTYKSKYERLSFLKRVRKNYLTLADRKNWTVIDAEAELSKVKERVKRELEELKI